MKILVTGAAGFLGSHLCDKLLESNHIVYGIDNFFRGSKNNLPTKTNFTFTQTDCLILADVVKAVVSFKPDIIVHYAAINGTRYFYDIPMKVCNDNIIMTQNILKASESVDIKKIVYASSSEVYGPNPSIPTNEKDYIQLYIEEDRDSYAASKATGEFLTKLWAQTFKKEYLILRPFNTYGSRMATNGYGQVIPEFIERLSSDDPFYMYGDGTQTRSFCHVDDHSKAATKLIEEASGIFNVGYNEEVTIKELAETIHSLAGKEFNPEIKPEWGHDTKRRKPDISKLKKFYKKEFKDLKSGLKELIFE